MKTCWLDLRRAGELRTALAEQALHHRIDGIVASDVGDLAALPPTVQRVLFADQEIPEDLPAVDVVVIDPARHGEPAVLAEKHPDTRFAPFVDVFDHDSLLAACRAAGAEPVTVMRFRDPTKIPLEILLAAANNVNGTVVTVVADIEEAEIVYGVLERVPTVC